MNTGTDRHLISVKPRLYREFNCPECASTDVEVLGTAFPGSHVFGRYRCASCGLDLLRDLPVGFAIEHPLAIRISDGKLYNPTGGEAWLYTPLIESFLHKSDVRLSIDRVVNRSCRKVILLNTIDFLYGHVLLKLLNAQYYLDRYPDHGLIVIVPRMFAWMVPKGVAELWILDIKLGQAHQWFEQLDAFVQDRIKEFDEVELGRAYSHPDPVQLDISRFTGIQPFDLDRFETSDPHITFIARADRLWFTNRVEKTIHRALNKLGLMGSVGRWHLARQDRMIRKVMRRIQRHLPTARFTVVGLGRPSGMQHLATDLRTTKMDVATEFKWCEVYAQSHVVVGIHGSNMLLPTALAAGCVEILPYDRYGNIIQDVAVRYGGRYQLYFYRFVDEFASPKSVTRHVVGMIKNFNDYRANMKTNTF